MKVGDSAELPIEPAHVTLFFEYLKEREQNEADVYKMLRNEAQAVKACTDRKLKVKYTKTKNKAHHRSPYAVVALVNSIVEKVCVAKGLKFNPNPQLVWENKEYWGGTAGGSKMSDAVYECNLVGRELREYEEATKVKVVHIVFVDGLVQWTARRSDLKRFVDLTNQGLIDHLLAGTEIETELEPILNATLLSAK